MVLTLSPEPQLPLPVDDIRSILFDDIQVPDSVRLFYSIQTNFTILFRSILRNILITLIGGVGASFIDRAQTEYVIFSRSDVNP